MGEGEMASDNDKLPGIKEDGLLKLGKCAVCKNDQIGKGVTFYVVEIARAAFDTVALRRRLGLEMQIGNAALARHMGPNEDLAKIFDGPRRVFVHEDCAHDIGSLLLLFPETKADTDAA